MKLRLDLYDIYNRGGDSCWATALATSGACRSSIARSPGSRITYRVGQRHDRENSDRGRREAWNARLV